MNCEKTAFRGRSRRLVGVLALAGACASIGAGSALAQSGGSAAPSDPAAPPPTPTSAPTGTYVHPILGGHTYGDGFGVARAGRGHQGQDVMARCGTPLVSVTSTKVRVNKFHGAAGFYLVLRDLATKQDFVYMHLRKRGLYPKGTRLAPGQWVGGSVGRTGNASACHLHFEIWSAPGYYRGGAPFNPAPALVSWPQAG